MATSSTAAPPPEEQTAGWITIEAAALKFIGSPLPQTVTVTKPGQAPHPIPVARVWSDPTLADPATAYWRRVAAGFGLWSEGAIILVVIAWFIFIRSGRQKIKSSQIRGQEVARLSVLIEQIHTFNFGEAALAHQRRADPLIAAGMDPRSALVSTHQTFIAPRLAGVPYPFETEMQHTMVVGAPGSGKSEAIHQLIDTIRQKGQRAIIFDPELDYIRAHFEEARDVILNPFDARSPGWSPFYDAVDRPDWDKLGHAIFKDPKSGDPYWVDVARSLFSWTGYQLRRRDPKVGLTEALDLLFGPTKLLKDLLEGTPAAKHLNGLEGARVSSLESVLTNGVEPLIYLYGSKDRFSIREWVNRPKEDGGFLFFSAPESHMDSIKPLLGFWSEIAVSALLSRHEAVRHPTWVILDEFHSAGRIDKLADGPQRLRKYGGAVVLGFQQMSQLQDLYGPDKSRTIIGQCQTKLILRAGDYDTAELMSEQIGRRVMRRVEENTSYGANSIRDGVGLAPKEELEPICLPEDVMNFPALQGVIRVSNARKSGPFPISPIQIAYVDRDRSTPGFVPKPSDPVDDYLRRLLAPTDPKEPSNEGADPSVQATRRSKPAHPSPTASPAGARGSSGAADKAESADPEPPTGEPSDPQASAQASGSLAIRPGADAAQGDGELGPAKILKPRRMDLPTEEAERLRRQDDEAEARLQQRGMSDRRNDESGVQTSVWQKESNQLVDGAAGQSTEVSAAMTDREFHHAIHHRQSGVQASLGLLASGVAGAAVGLGADQASHGSASKPVEVTQSDGPDYAALSGKTIDLDRDLHLGR